jgi:hypothetical protein
MASSKVITLRIKQANQSLKKQSTAVKATKERIAKLNKDLAAAKASEKKAPVKKAAKKVAKKAAPKKAAKKVAKKAAPKKAAKKVAKKAAPKKAAAN